MKFLDSSDLGSSGHPYPCSSCFGIPITSSTLGNKPKTAGTGDDSGKPIDVKEFVAQQTGQGSGVGMDGEIPVGYGHAVATLP